jgi:predicted XRE-type DNA-binding protein
MNKKKTIFVRTNKTKMKRQKHYGKALLKAIEQKGLKKKNIFLFLKMSKPTFNKRLVDGNFTEFEKAEIEKNYL